MGGPGGCGEDVFTADGDRDSGGNFGFSGSDSLTGGHAPPSDARLPPQGGSSIHKASLLVPFGSRHATLGGTGSIGGRQAAQQASQRQTGGWEDWSPPAPHDRTGRRS